MIDAALSLPTVFECIILFSVMFLFILPGILIGILIYGGDNIEKSMLIGSSLGISIYVLVGFALSSIERLTAVVFVGVWLAITAVLSLFVLFRQGFPHPALNQSSVKRLVFILAVFFFLFFLYYVWEGKEPGVAAWDRSEHVVKLLYLFYHSRLPITEIGMDASAFYPEGFNLNAFLFVSLVRGIHPTFAYQGALIGYFAFCMAFMVFPSYAIGKNTTNSNRGGLFGVLCYLPGSYLLVFESMPSSLAMILVGAVILLMLQSDFDFQDGFVTVFLLVGILLIHSVIFLYISIILIVLAIVDSTSSINIVGSLLRISMLIVLSGGLGLFILQVFHPPLLHGTISKVFDGDSTGGTTQQSQSFVSQIVSFFPIKWQGMAFYFVVIAPLLPILALGVHNALKRRRWNDLSMVLASIYISMAGFTRFDNRVRFFMLYPVVVISSLGWETTVEIIKNKSNWKGIPKLTTNLLKTGAIAGLFLMLVITPIANAALGHGNVTGNWNTYYRTKGYVDEEAFQLVTWLTNNGFQDLGIIATPDDGSHYQIVEAMTDNKILMASGWSEPQSFRDITCFFNSSTNMTELRTIAQTYNLSAYLVRGDVRFPHLLTAFPQGVVMQATEQYRLVILNR